MEQNRIKVIFENDTGIKHITSGYKMLLRRACTAALRLEDYPDDANVGVVFTNRKGLSDIEGSGHSGGEPFRVTVGDGDMLGWIYISLEDTVRKSKLRGNPVTTELAYNAIKGALIMLGYSDSDPRGRKTLEIRAEWIMHEFGMPISTRYGLLNYA